MDHAARSRRFEPAVYGALVVCALVLRLVVLTHRPLQYDEAQIGYFSWRLFETGSFHYRPLLHGPLQYYGTSLAYALLGVGDFTLRFLPALLGSAMVGMPYLIRRRIGGAAALAASAFLCFSPSFLYYSRFAREDIWIAFLALAMLVVAVRFADRPRGWHLPLLGGLLALSFATKESTFLTVAAVGAFLAGLAIAGLRPELGVITRDRRLFALALVAFVLVFALLFTDLGRHPQGLIDGVYNGPRYWLEQHRIGRGGEPWYFYLVVLASYEWLALVLGVVGAVAAIRRHGVLGLFLVWMTVALLALYSYAGERFAWLVLNPLLPLILLAGIGVQAIWRARGRRAARVALAVTAVGAAATIASSLVTSFAHSSDPSEPLVVVHTTPAAERIADRVTALAHAGASVVVDTGDANTFPWAWYLRGTHVGYIDARTPGFRPRADVLLLSERGRTALAGSLAGYRGRSFASRGFWDRDYGRLTPASFMRWQLHRRPWSPLGETRAWLYVRRPGA